MSPVAVRTAKPRPKPSPGSSNVSRERMLPMWSDVMNSTVREPSKRTSSSCPLFNNICAKRM